MEIIFNNKKDAECFHTHLKHQLHPFFFINHYQLVEDETAAKVIINIDGIERIGPCIKAFYAFIVKNKLTDLYRSILRDQYFYTDEEEQEHILHIIYSIMDGQREDLAAFIDEKSFKGPLEETIKQVFKEKLSFSFDSFLKFRMRPLYEPLKRIVELSIDEYKMEQEYQYFIETLRHFIDGRKAKFSHLHLVIQEEITFYDHKFQKLSREQLMKMIDRKLLSNHPVYVDSATIAPLLSIAPSVVYVYTNDSEQPLVRTIKNIFEERVAVFRIECFNLKKFIGE